jgi:hypothetical protein
MGMTIRIFRSDLGDGTNGGVSSYSRTLCVTNCEGPFEPSEGSPAVKLVMAEPIGGRKILRLIPECAEGKGTMFGGNYGSTSDSRFSQLCEKLLGSAFYGAVAIHDRVEG